MWAIKHKKGSTGKECRNGPGRAMPHAQPTLVDVLETGLNVPPTHTPLALRKFRCTGPRTNHPRHGGRIASASAAVDVPAGRGRDGSAGTMPRGCEGDCYLGSDRGVRSPAPHRCSARRAPETRPATADCSSGGQGRAFPVVVFRARRASARGSHPTSCRRRQP